MTYWQKLLQTTEFAQELLECPDRPKLGQLTVHPEALTFHIFNFHGGNLHHIPNTSHVNI